MHFDNNYVGPLQHSDSLRWVWTIILQLFETSVLNPQGLGIENKHFFLVINEISPLPKKKNLQIFILTVTHRSIPQKQFAKRTW